MAWTTPQTYTAGALTAAEMNLIRDNFLALKSMLESIGIYGSGADTLAAEAFSISVTGTQNVTSGSDVLLTPDALEATSGSEYSYTSSGVQAISAGIYWCNGWVSFDSDSAGQRQVWLEDSAAQYNRIILPNASTGRDTAIGTDCLIELSDAETVKLYCRQNSGSTLSVDFRLQMFRVST